MIEETVTPKSQIINHKSKIQFGLTDLALILMTMIWGTNFVVAKSTFAQLAPMVFMTLRFIFASIVILAVLLVRERSFSLRRVDYIRVALLGLVGTSIYQPLFINGLALTTASNSALLLASTPALIALINRVLGRERLDLRGWFGITLAFTGIALIVESGGGVELGSATLFGDLLVLCAAIAWSLYSVLSAPMLKIYSPLRLAALSTAMGTVPFFFIGAPALLAQDWSRVDVRGWGGVTFSSVFAIALAYIIWNTGVQKIGGARTAIYNNLTPVVAALVASIFLNEQITSLKIIGAVVIFVGLYLARTGNLVMEPEA
jgi:drug/metabolite transporter (DMT)-like permease